MGKRKNDFSSHIAYTALSRTMNASHQGEIFQPHFSLISLYFVVYTGDAVAH